uniref:Uncharacterized protein n=1 Tax=Anguilla anguilla TaxID=7936 RepID=A0A0E9TAT1_ANGAN
MQRKPQQPRLTPAERSQCCPAAVESFMVC